MKGLEPSTFCMANARCRSGPFAPVRSNHLYVGLPSQTNEHDRTRANAEPCHPCHGVGRVERLAYTRTQAAEALGISRSTFDRRVLPFVETIEMPWHAADSGRGAAALLKEPRGYARARAQPPMPGRPPAVPPDLVRRIRAERVAGKSLRQIARDLNASGTPTPHAGVQWWPSTIRAILRRAA
jgi:hypothetical protein